MNETEQWSKPNNENVNIANTYCIKVKHNIMAWHKIESRVVQHLPRHLKVEGSIPAAAAAPAGKRATGGKRREKRFLAKFPTTTSSPFSFCVSRLTFFAKIQ
jgi:hypothetical protein